MTFNTYQLLAARTMNPELTQVETILHALHGLSAEVGEIHSIYQKSYQIYYGLPLNTAPPRDGTWSR